MLREIGEIHDAIHRKLGSSLGFFYGVAEEIPLLNACSTGHQIVIPKCMESTRFPTHQAPIPLGILTQAHFRRMHPNFFFSSRKTVRKDTVRNVLTRCALRRRSARPGYTSSLSDHACHARLLSHQDSQSLSASGPLQAWQAEWGYQPCPSHWDRHPRIDSPAAKASSHPTRL